MARFVYDKQVQQIADGLIKCYTCTKSLTSEKVPVVITGLGKDFLARRAAESLCVDAIIDIGTLLPQTAVLATPAFAVALMTANKLEGENVR
jgi:hypothetical protein